MYDLGISIYIGLEDYSLEENIKYLKMAHDLGYEYVFSSAHIGEAKQEYDELNALIMEASQLGMKVSLDVSKNVMSKLEVCDKLYALRLDYGFSDEDIIDYSNNASFLIELNASTINHERLVRLIEKGLNVKRTRFSFNFYPKKHTGHTIEFVKHQTAYLQQLGFYVAAFLPSSVGKRPPMYEGLPSVELHRYQDLGLSVEDFKACNLNGLYFGDAYATFAELQMLKEHNQDVILFKFIPYKGKIDNSMMLIDHEFALRSDSPATLARIGNYKITNVVKPQNAVSRMKYDVTIDNEGFLRYQGEINICLDNFEQDNRSNVVGHIVTNEIEIMKIYQGKRFKFILGE